MINTLPPFEQVIEKGILIEAPAAKVWMALTRRELIVQWMSESELTVITSWETGTPFVIRGDRHGHEFENRGTLLQFEPERLLAYSHLSSLSGLADELHNYCILEFRLLPLGDQTTLTLTLRNFPTESIYRHMAFYWNVALGLLKRFTEAL